VWGAGAAILGEKTDGVTPHGKMKGGFIFEAFTEISACEDKWCRARLNTCHQW